jgi:hypothetical protein
MLQHNSFGELISVRIAGGYTGAGRILAVGATLVAGHHQPVLLRRSISGVVSMPGRHAGPSWLRALLETWRNNMSAATSNDTASAMSPTAARIYHT